MAVNNLTAALEITISKESENKACDLNNNLIDGLLNLSLSKQESKPTNSQKITNANKKHSAKTKSNFKNQSNATNQNNARNVTNASNVTTGINNNIHNNSRNQTNEMNQMTIKASDSNQKYQKNNMNTNNLANPMLQIKSKNETDAKNSSHLIKQPASKSLMNQINAKNQANINNQSLATNQAKINTQTKEKNRDNQINQTNAKIKTNHLKQDNQRNKNHMKDQPNITDQIHAKNQGDNPTNAKIKTNQENQRNQNHTKHQAKINNQTNEMNRISINNQSQTENQANINHQTHDAKYQAKKSTQTNEKNQDDHKNQTNSKIKTNHLNQVDQRNQSNANNLTAINVQASLSIVINAENQTNEETQEALSKADDQLIKSESQKRKINDMRSWNSYIFCNELFEIVFDILTPRPHFIVKFKSKLERARHDDFKLTLNVNGLSELELKSLLVLIKSFRKKFDLMNCNMVLSFHTGYWATQKKFHCHLCVDVEAYLRVFNQSNLDLENFKPTKCWSILLNKGNQKAIKTLYIENVVNAKNKAIIDSNKYKSKEIVIIEKNRDYQKIFLHKSVDYHVSFNNFEPKMFLRLVDKNEASSSARRVKQNKESIYFDLINSCINMASSLDMFSKYNGCHICINLNQNDAYLHFSGDFYYRLHPNPNLFYNNFKRFEDYVIQT